MIGDRRQKHNKKQGFVVEISPNLLIFICANEMALNRTILELKSSKISACVAVM